MDAINISINSNIVGLYLYTGIEEISTGIDLYYIESSRSTAGDVLCKTWTGCREVYWY